VQPARWGFLNWKSVMWLVPAARIWQLFCVTSICTSFDFCGVSIAACSFLNFTTSRGDGRGKLFTYRTNLHEPRDSDNHNALRQYRHRHSSNIFCDQNQLQTSVYATHAQSCIQPLSVVSSLPTISSEISMTIPARGRSVVNSRYLTAEGQHLRSLTSSIK
jgi:hypothetical protein